MCNMGMIEIDHGNDLISRTPMRPRSLSKKGIWSNGGKKSRRWGPVGGQRDRICILRFSSTVFLKILSASSMREAASPQ
jgi:hypothetical protein